MSEQQIPESGYQCDFCLDRFLQNFEDLHSANFAGFPPAEDSSALLGGGSRIQSMGETSGVFTAHRGDPCKMSWVQNINMTQA